MQAGFSQNRQVLGNCGVGYSDKYTYLFGHHRVPDAFREARFDPAGYLATDIRAAFLTHDINVISSEEFAKLRLCELERVKTLFSDCAIRLIYVLRHPMTMFPSLWQEMVKHGADLTFHDFIETASGRANDYDPETYSNIRQLNRMEAVFGREALSLPVFENITASGEDLFEYVVHSYLIPKVQAPDFTKATEHSNASLAPHFIELIRCMNLVCREDISEQLVIKTDAAFHRHFHKIVTDPGFEAFSAALQRNWKTVGLSQADDLFLQEDRLILERYGDLIPNKAGHDQIRHSAENATREVPYAERRWIHAEGQVDYIRDLIRTYVLAG